MMIVLRKCYTSVNAGQERKIPSTLIKAIIKESIRLQCLFFRWLLHNCKSLYNYNYNYFLS
jgi:hypothetical protein